MLIAAFFVVFALVFVIWDVKRWFRMINLTELSPKERLFYLIVRKD